MRYLSRRARLIPRELPPLAQLLRGRCYAVDETVPKGFQDGASRISYCAVLFTVTGSSHYTIGREKVRLTPGSLLILPPGISFSEKTPEACHNRYLMLGGPLSREISTVIPQGGSFAFWPNCPPDVAAALGRCVELAQERPEIPTWGLAAELCRLVESILAGNPDRKASPPLQDRVRALVSSAAGDLWRVPTLARRLGMSESAFAHQFRAQTGEAPAAFVRRLRCALARAMLETGLGVAETSLRLGFKNPYHFSKVFSSEAGHPPSQCIPHQQRLHRSLRPRHARRKKSPPAGTRTPG